MSRNIYIDHNVVCPVCKNLYKIHYPNPRMYVASGRDSDHRVTGYTWTQGVQTDEIPHYYAVAQCPQCLFADFRENLESPKQGMKEIKLYETRRNMDFKKVLILRKLKRLISEEKINIKGAICLHLSALYIALQAPKEHWDYNKLGRLYLRTSWLFKELRGDSFEPEPIEKDNTPSLSLDKLCKTIEGMQSSLNGFLSDLVDLRKYGNARSEELKLPSDNNPYNSITTSLEFKVKEIQTLLEMVQQSAMRDTKGDLIIIPATFTITDTDLQEVLNDIESKWQDFPGNEEVCVRRAIEAFDYSFKTEDMERSPEQSLSIVNLIIKLLLKTGDLNGALNYLTEMLRNGSRDKQNLQQRLNEAKHGKNMSEFDAKNIMRKMATITSALTQGIESRRAIIEMIYEKNKEKILGIVKTNLQNTPAEQEQAILSAGFAPEIVHYLKEHGLIKVEDAKKSGWFAKKK